MMVFSINIPTIRIPILLLLLTISGLIGLNVELKAQDAAEAAAEAGAENESAHYLVWNPERQTFSANLEDEPLDQTLGRIVASAGWRVKVEPGLRYQISARFKELPLQRAIQFLLPDLSFAMLNKPGSPTELLIFQSSSAAATQLVEGEQTSNEASVTAGEVGDEWIVLVKADSKEDIEAIAASVGATVVGSMEDLGVYRLKFDTEADRDAAKSALESDSRIENLEPNYISNPLPTPQAFGDTAIGLMNLKVRPAGTSSGDYLTVALVDTGLNSVSEEFDAFVLPQKSVFENQSETPGAPAAFNGNDKDSLLHGTITGFALLQAASQQTSSFPTEQGLAMRIQPINVFQPNQPETTSFDVAMGLKLAIESGATIVNASLGGYGPSRAQDLVIQQGAEMGVSFYFAAGNEPTAQPTYPAANPLGVAVTAGTSTGLIAQYANHGEFVDVVAPDFTWTPFESRTYATRGTSVSSAIIAGVAAGQTILSGKEPQQVEQEIRTEFAPVAISP